jgi:cob(I)alamin adenosyltransferase
MGKIYTKTGDCGETSLLSGTRVRKYHLAIDVYGEVDHLNSLIGFLRSQITKKHSEYELLKSMQNQLFVLGSLLACEPEKRDEWKLPQLDESLIASLESHIDQLTKALPELKNFILPGGCEAASRSHLCRTTTRLVERKIVEYFDNSKDTIEFSMRLLNRMSDYFFVLSRSLNHEAGEAETIWTL